MIKIVAIILIVALLGVVFGLSKINPQVNTSKAPEKLTISGQGQPSFALVYIAQKKGFFKDENLEITYKDFLSGRDALDDALKGGSDIAAVGETPIVRKVYEGEKISVISTLYTSTKNTGLIARKDKGINKIKDLVGKKIGIIKNSTGEFFLFSLLVSQGIQISEVNLVEVSAQDTEKMLREKKIDAAVALDPFLYQISKSLGDEVNIFKSDVYTNTSVLAGKKEQVAIKKEALIRLLRALVRAERFYRTDHDSAVKLVMAGLPQISEETVVASINNVEPKIKLNNVLLTVLTREADWFNKNGIYKTPVPDFNQVIFTDYLKDADVTAVTLY